MNQPDANTTWFTFNAPSDTFFGVYSFTGFEEVNKCYEFSIGLVSTTCEADIETLLGEEACLNISDMSGNARHVHGIIGEISQLSTANRFTHYHCKLVPRFWFLDKIRDHRIFQHLAVPDIIKKILEEQGFSDSAYSFKLFFDYEAREYCVQYGETVLHFIARLCEEEGIFYYFTHSKDSHCLCFSDREGGPKISGESALRFFPGSGLRQDEAVINKVSLAGQINSNAATFSEWNFEKPQLNLLIGKTENDTQFAPVPDGMKLEQYRFRHLYQLQAEGARYAELELMRQMSFKAWLDIESDVSTLLPGHSFQIQEHPRDDLNLGWWLVSVHHHGEQPQILEHEAEGKGLSYHNEAKAIPETTRFVPASEHPKPRILGDQSAIVTGPEGEEIYTDEHGRVKVQFHWDRDGNWDENSSCWVRVSQRLAGDKFGSMSIPRIGHEVMVSFLEGDPDKPVIEDRVHHRINSPAYRLPEHKTRTGIKTMSTPGEANEVRGFNEISFEDKKNEEEIYRHAQKDMNIHVKKDQHSTILHNKHRVVKDNNYSVIQGQDHHIVEMSRKTELRADDHLTVHGDTHIHIEGKLLEKAGEEFHHEAGQKMIFEGTSEVIIKISSGVFIIITPTGIKLSRTMFDLNSGGSPGKGSGANPLLPEGAMTPEVPPPPCPDCLSRASAQRASLSAMEES